jgi:lipopolysaccharide/colanic/teichoic acid biosynthesis glycosyltransferase
MECPSGPVMNRVLGLLNRSIALLAVLTLWPIAVCLAVLIKMHDGGPVFFMQERVGLKGKRFTLYKFRTMRCDVERYGTSPREDRDPRVTAIGRWMRRMSLDELPQILNVFRGEMRLVGPRPEMPFIVEQYDDRQRQRLKIKPGITGLWQVSPHRNDPIHEHVEYDLAYIAHRRPILDIALIIATLGLANRSGA